MTQTTLFGQMVIGTVFVIAGCIKLLDTNALHAFAKVLGVPRRAATIVERLIPIIELAIGLLLFVGWQTKAVVTAGALVSTGFVCALITAHARGVKVNCGCFGSIEGPHLSWVPTVRALTLLLFLCLLLLAGPLEQNAVRLSTTRIDGMMAVLSGFAFSASFVLLARIVTLRRELRLARAPHDPGVVFRPPFVASA